MSQGKKGGPSTLSCAAMNTVIERGVAVTYPQGQETIGTSFREEDNWQVPFEMKENILSFYFDNFCLLSNNTL